MNLRDTKIPGCYEIDVKVFKDDRGRFVKTFHEEVYREFGLVTHFAETYYSVSQQNVLRGLHFQVPPKDHAKLIHCVEGEILDVAVDLRVGSPTYGEHAAFTLTPEKGNAVYVPAGLAHGFYIVSEMALVMYQVSSVYAPEHEGGILWNSAGIPWEAENPIVSAKDQQWKSLAEFESPFVFES
ncbi:MAG: dTDP-4-dehydrorhamnose 3,5-epimerase [Cyanobacteria bacterium SID2]|nr:dTDP-4-dehydrorhamnose 3,5-epimerase [Cyanobacteria bacterium SID2]MBP0002628.1 dTDP-4-dehydrorhamnose 3,5-epimerase [Cyanobacteria bacterium SBC]